MSAPGATEPVPPELRQLDIAQQLADLVWTYDGQPYASLALEGRCGSTLCDIELQGVPAFAPEEDGHVDLYLFRVERSTGTVAPIRDDNVQLTSGYPPELDIEIDRVVRAGVNPEVMTGLELRNAVWMQPPNFGQFIVSYDSGNEEGSRAIQVVLDLETGEIISVDPFATL